MATNVERRAFLGAAGTVVAASVAANVSAAEAGGGKIKIVGISCSPRKGKNTAAAVQACLEAHEKEHEKDYDVGDANDPRARLRGLPEPRRETFRLRR